ncbi:hypothetical protein DSC_07590 [Pseudoxanthomonas spadix BD-a59]|uniref:Uncharacterized protein n=1 Tax=Pseudoxanthomonas spadix (strain BD-a59) TaxID=1045855 RepID=G7UTR6_PSEUP|nr:hypothetical protein [Pseudoxanthomonas spadix]AER56169.1 hypothetical protein DSC_07590 [Pseudoxanthomonas spadix BD-a59]
MRPFVVYWNNIPSPYMVERFNALADRNPFEFEAWFNDRIHSDRSWTVDEAAWRFRYRYPLLRPYPALAITGAWAWSQSIRSPADSHKMPRRIAGSPARGRCS